MNLSAADYALNFNGTTSGAQTSSQVIPSTGNFTVESWINPESGPNVFQTIMFAGSAVDDRFGLYYYNNDTFHIGRDSANTNVTVGNITGRWSHVAVSVNRSTNQVTVFLNGTQIYQAAMGATDFNGVGSFYIGREVRPDAALWFKGQIDQVKVWSSVLTQAQVQLSMNAWDETGVTGATTLVAHYDFNDNTQATTVRDMQGSANLTVANRTTTDYKPILETPTRSGYSVYKFTRTYLTAAGGWTIPAGVNTMDYLLVAGGGGGGGRIGGGGGAGGLLTGTSSVTPNTTIPIVVGTAGKAGQVSVGDSTGSNGGNTRALSLDAIGGGGGGGTDGFNGLAGGSGGGAGRWQTAAIPGAGTTGQGNSGGDTTYSASTDRSGGGGGAGGVGADGGVSGNGGVGLASSITGTSLFYAGGGGGGSNNNVGTVAAPGVGGSGGGGAGSRISIGLSGSANTGGGGGGGGFTSEPGGTGGYGGTGVVIFAAASAAVVASVPATLSTWSARTATLSVDTSGSRGTLTYQWQVSNDGGSSWNNVSGGSGATTASYTTPTLQVSDQGNQYKVVISSSINGTTDTFTTSATTLRLADAVSGITFDKNYSGSTSTTQNFGSGDRITLPSPTRTGYTLDGWYTVTSGGTRLGLGGDSFSPLNSSDLVLRYEVDDLDSYSGTGTTITDTARVANQSLTGAVNGTLTNGPGYSATSGAYLAMDGVNDYIITGNLKDRLGSTNNQVSVFTWVYPTGNGVIVSELGQTTVNDAWHASNIEVVNGNLKFAVWPVSGASANVVTQNAIQMNTWHYVGFTHSGTQLKAYVDGVLVGQSSYTKELSTPGTYYALGAADATSLGDGTYGDFRFGSLHVYKSALTDAAITANYQATCARFDSACTERTLYAQWTADTYAVTFNKGTTSAATGSNQNSTKSYGVNLALPNSATANSYFTRAGYTVTSWSTTADGSTSDYALGANFTTEAATTLYPVWTADSHTITWDVNGGTLAGSEPASFLTGDSVRQPSNPSRSGFSFVGWATSETAGNGNVADQVSWPYSPAGIINITLHAIWQSTLAITTPTTGLSGTYGQAYSLSIAASGGSGSNSYSSTGLPAGLTLNPSTGVISGTPTSAQTSTVIVTVQDSAGSIKLTSGFDIVIAQASLTSPAAPTLAAPAGELKKFTVTWSAVTNASSYSVKIYSSANTLLETITGLSGTSATITATNFAAIADDTTYKVSITPVASANYVAGTESTRVNVTTNNTYTVTWDSNGGSSVSSGTFVTGATVSQPTAPTKTGYTFLGWSTSETSQNGDSGTLVGSWPLTPASAVNLTLYARWSADNLTVTFKSNYTGGPSDITQAVVAGQATTLTTNPFTRTGYTFTGWKTVSSGTGTSYSNVQNISITNALTLFAQWSANTYTVTYSANGATGSAVRASDSFTVDTTALTLPTKGSLAKTGYTFAGWSETNGGSVIQGSYTPTSSVTLYAVWEAATFNITYNNNLATSGNPSATSGTYTTGGTAITLAAQSSMARSGYTFDGWSTVQNDVSTKITTSGSYTITSSVILYALWNAVDYTVTYSSQGSTSGTVPADTTFYNIGNSAVIKANSGSLSKTGYSFAGWTLNSDGSGTVYQSGSSYVFSSQNITLYAKWTANTYTITYNTNGATGSPSRASDTYTTGDAGLSLPNINTMVKTGYDFAGWSPSASGSALNNNGYTTTSNQILYAVWTLKSINYTYLRGQANSTNLSVNNMAYFPGPVTDAGLYGSRIFLPTVGTGTGNISATASLSGSTYQFMGWSDGSSNYGPGDAFTLRATDVSFTAIWLRLYQVRYVLNGGAGVLAVDDECTQADDTCLSGATITLNGTPTKSGYNFTGWQDQSGRAFTSAQQNVTLAADSFIFYAQWEAIDYTMNFDVQGGSATVGIQTKNIGNTVTMPSPGTKTGYTFSGWSDGSVTLGAGTTYLVGSSNKSFTAQWTPNTYVVSYNWTGGSGTPVSDASYTYGTAGITLPNGSTHTRDGYEFAGWATSANGPAISNTFVPTGDTMLYARWVDGSYTLTLNARGGNLSQSSYFVARGAQSTLPLPTREGFVFEGWFQDSALTVLEGAGNSSITPTQSQTFYAKWVQNSLSGINPAHINSLATINIAGAHTWTGSHAPSGTGAALAIPQGALPNGTELKVSFIEDQTRPRDLISQSYAYYSSVVVHWLSGTGDSATVPATAANKPISLTLTNPSILPGAKVFMILGGVATEVATATQAGQVSFDITQDPEFVVAATPPTLPASITATQVSQNKSVVSWTAPASTGGSPVTGYTVTALPGGATCSTSELTCEISGLSSGVDYSYSVIATNAIGTSNSRQASIPFVPVPVINIAPAPPTDPITPEVSVSSEMVPVARASRDAVEVTSTGTVAPIAPQAKAESAQKKAQPAQKVILSSEALDLRWIVLVGIVAVAGLLLLVVAYRRRRRKA
jgi:uncharacterized repeat protein (TIGR02543 family)